ncbi:hypothetical protein HRbin30_00279 [bacterium HR30]|nr:hypothetical protein HRbin30_00279 [bacterium HR30]
MPAVRSQVFLEFWLRFSGTATLEPSVWDDLGRWNNFGCSRSQFWVQTRGEKGGEGSLRDALVIQGCRRTNTLVPNIPQTLTRRRHHVAHAPAGPWIDHGPVTSTVEQVGSDTWGAAELLAARCTLERRSTLCAACDLELADRYGPSRLRRVDLGSP